MSFETLEDFPKNHNSNNKTGKKIKPVTPQKAIYAFENGMQNTFTSGNWAKVTKCHEQNNSHQIPKTNKDKRDQKLNLEVQN